MIESETEGGEGVLKEWEAIIIDDNWVGLAVGSTVRWRSMRSDHRNAAACEEPKLPPKCAVFSLVPGTTQPQSNPQLKSRNSFLIFFLFSFELEMAWDYVDLYTNF